MCGKGYSCTFLHYSSFNSTSLCNWNYCVASHPLENQKRSLLSKMWISLQHMSSNPCSARHSSNDEKPQLLSLNCSWSSFTTFSLGHYNLQHFSYPQHTLIMMLMLFIYTYFSCQRSAPVPYTSNRTDFGLFLL